MELTIHNTKKYVYFFSTQNITLATLTEKKYTRSLVRAFLGPSKKRTSQKPHHWNEYKIAATWALSGVAIK